MDPQPKLHAARILMLDDHVASTCMMTNILNRLGYTELRSINSPEELLEACASFQPDLLLLDLGMPVLDGFQVLELIRKNVPAAAHIPVLVVTGDPTSKNKQRALAAGATDLLAKPFDVSELNMRIRNILEAHFLRREIQHQNTALEERVRERTARLQHALDDLQAAQRQVLHQERSNAFSQMAGGVVHDFSNALMAIIGYSEMLIAADGRNLSDKATALEYLGIINTAGRDAAKIVSRLRDFYRPRSDSDLFEPLDLNQIVNEAVLLTKPKWKRQPTGESKPISVETELGEIGPIQGNAAELREMLTNLIFNAADAMPDGGVITLRTSQPNDVEIALEVQDTGSGMTAEVQARCLDPFFTTKGDEGTGLGLAMVLGIVQRHKASIDIESQPGEGTTFCITLPRHFEELEQTSACVPDTIVQFAAA
jgi:signal transduction histidine kinase